MDRCGRHYEFRAFSGMKMKKLVKGKCAVVDSGSSSTEDSWSSAFHNYAYRDDPGSGMCVEC